MQRVARFPPQGMAHENVGFDAEPFDERESFVRQIGKLVACSALVRPAPAASIVGDRRELAPQLSYNLAPRSRCPSPVMEEHDGRLARAAFLKVKRKPSDFVVHDCLLPSHSAI